MNIRYLIAIAACGLMAPAARATTAPFGIASAYNVVALTGNISDSSDISGWAATAGEMTLGTTVGGNLGSDPYLSLASYALVSSTGLVAGQNYNIDGKKANVYAPGSSGTVNLNNGGQRVTSGGSGINFTSLATTLDNESTYLGSYTPNGTNVGTNDPHVSNPQWYVLQGTSPTLNVFDISAATFSSSKPLDIVVPAGSTVIINVEGTSDTLGAAIYINGTQYSPGSASTDDILFNFPDATTVTVDAALSASLLAPFAYLSGDQDMGGNIIAARVGQLGQLDNVAFQGNLPTPALPPVSLAPEPDTWLLLGSGLLLLLGALWSRRIGLSR